MKKIIAALIGMAVAAAVLAQQNPMKYGKVDEKHWSLEKVSYDSSANAVVLCDFGTLNFGYAKPTAISQHRRIKILNEKGLQQANVVLPFYAKNNNEKIVRLKAQTLNLNNGKVEKTKVKDFFEADINANWKSKRFSFPNVKPGSIIEFSYTKLIENNFSFEDWEFQSDIPTLHSEYHATISQGLDVRIFFNSRRLYKKYGKEATNSWYLENLPAHKPEKFCPNPQDYIESISFQLAGYYKRDEMGGSEYVNIMTNWDELASEIYNYHPINSYLTKKGKVRELLGSIDLSSATAEEKVKAIYSYVTSNFDYNGKTRMYTEQDFNDFIEMKRGNSAEMNLLLVALLREADLQADPALISTKEHGIMSESYPLLDQFNKTVGSVAIERKTIILDATNPYLAYNLLPKEDLNQKALVYNRSGAKWIQVEAPEKSQKTMFIIADLSGDTAKFNFNLMTTGYYAAEMRKTITSLNDRNEMLSQLMSDEAEERLDSIEVKNLDKPGEKLVIALYLSEPDNPLKKNNSMFYYEPPELRYLIDNPFTQAERELPVDLYFNSHFNLRYSIILPNTIEINELPESIKFVMDGNKADFTYQVNATGNNIQFHINLNHFDHYFSPYEYPNLRQMYTLIKDKLSQPIVLKKKKT